ncbi:MAG: cytochrome c [Candidatus Obscuribacterales bacterium]|nr:cytochrome c [Candidatus Obscuribacterales bacterium]
MPNLFTRFLAVATVFAIISGLIVSAKAERVPGAKSGQEIYKQNHCAACHSIGGKGKVVSYRNHNQWNLAA